jgi:glycosyltransferase involved in cell wall biosynthesis
MRVSVVIRTKDEAPRLRLMLASMSRQTLRPEVIVVNDGSSDHTEDVIAEASRWLPILAVHHQTPHGRSAASNVGAAAAAGDILLLLDGDTLAGPELVARHAAVHAADSPRVVRGETYHLRGTRFFLDPETGAPRPGEEERVARLSERELTRLRVTLAQVTETFDSIIARATPGIYPGAGPRRLNEIEMDALRHHPDCAVLWAAASGNNMSMRRDAFMRVGGFHRDLDINEHRQLALKLCLDGARMAPADGACSYHLTHRSGWRDPLDSPDWERIFFGTHPIAAVKLLVILWASLSDHSRIPPECRILSLPQLEAAAAGKSGIDYDAVRSLIGASAGERVAERP